jgi:hypothetical protein
VAGARQHLDVFSRAFVNLEEQRLSGEGASALPHARRPKPSSSWCPEDPAPCGDQLALSAGYVDVRPVDWGRGVWGWCLRRDAERLLPPGQCGLPFIIFLEPAHPARPSADFCACRAFKPPRIFPFPSLPLLFERSAGNSETSGRLRIDRGWRAACRCHNAEKARVRQPPVMRTPAGPHARRGGGVAAQVLQVVLCLLFIGQARAAMTTSVVGGTIIWSLADDFETSRNVASPNSLSPKQALTPVASFPRREPSIPQLRVKSGAGDR